jgi:hypothetical protein
MRADGRQHGEEGSVPGRLRAGFFRHGDDLQGFRPSRGREWPWGLLPSMKTVPESGENRALGRPADG